MLRGQNVQFWFHQSREACFSQSERTLDVLVGLAAGKILSGHSG